MFSSTCLLPFLFLKGDAEVTDLHILLWLPIDVCGGGGQGGAGGGACFLDALQTAHCSFLAPGRGCACLHRISLTLSDALNPPTIANNKGCRVNDK